MAPHTLDQWAKMNIWCDGKAKETLYEQVIDPTVPITGWRISIEGEVISADWEKRITEAYTEREVKQYLHSRKILHSNSWKDVDWELFYFH